MWRRFLSAFNRDRLAFTARVRPTVEILEDRITPVSFGYALGIGSPPGDNGLAVAMDSAGNSYATGYFQGSTDFDPGPGILSLTSAGLSDIYVAKYDPAGGLVWARDLGGFSNDLGYGIFLDAAGNIFTIGFFNGTADFDPGPGTFNLTSAGLEDIVIIKLDSAGNFLWARNMGGTNYGEGSAIALDPAGNVFATGRFSGTLDFDPGPGTFNLTSAGGDDIFIVKLDGAGNFAWATAMGSANNDWGRGIVADGAGNVYTTGYFTNTVDFDPGAGTFNLTSAGSDDIFISKLDGAGNLAWALRWGGPSVDHGRGIALDAAGNIYTTGSFWNTVDFDPGAGTYNLTSAGGDDIFVSKLDSAGNFVWSRSMGGISSDNGFAIALDTAANIYTTGGFRVAADFDPGPGTFTLVPNGSVDVFVSKLDNAGNFAWAAGLGGANIEEGYSIAVDADSNVCTTGIFNGTADFDPGAATFNLTPVGGFDAFVSKLVQFGVTIVQSGGTTSVAEGGAADTDTVFLNEVPTANVLVTLVPDAQVTIVPAILTFTPANWNIPQTVTVTANDDPLIEGNHTGVISFTTASADTNYNALTVPSLTANITDNDLPPAGVTVTQSGGSTNVAEGGATDTYTVVLDSQPTTTVTINFNAGVQLLVSTPLLTFTPANWNTAQTVTVTAVDDAAVEGNHTGTIVQLVASADLAYNAIAIASVTANISDNDLVAAGVLVTPSASSTDVSEAGGIDSYTVVLNALPTANVIVTLSTTSQLLPSTPTLTFTPANWNLAQTVIVQANDDAIAQGTRSQTINHTATSSDLGYNGIAIAAISVNITDNDVAGLTLVPATIDLTENGTSNTYTAVLNSQPTANVIVNVAGDSQVTLAVSTLVFTTGNWNVPQTISVRAVDDTLAEGLHNGLITHTLTSGDTDYNGMSRTVTARITDNEAPGVLITQTNGPITILEGTTKTYTAVLNSPPATDVVLYIAPDPQVSVTPTSITFTPGDWNVPRPVVVTANDDGIEEGDHIGRITHTTTSATTSFNNLTVASVTANIVDNDGAAAFGTERADQILVSFTPANIKVTVNGQITTLPNTLTQLLLFAGLGNDSIQIVAPTIPVVVIGGPGVDKVFITGQAASNNFVLGDSVINVNGQSVGVWEAESLTVGGKAGNDVFTVQAVPAFPVELKGDAGTDVVIGPSRPNTWQITGPNAGTLDTSIKLSTFENWTGGAGTDSFVFAAGKSITGRVDGGLGQNTLDFSTATAAIAVNLQTGIATGSKSFANITTVVGGKGVADKLIAADQSNLWNITAANSGSVNGVSFRGFENLTGGAQDDTYLLADNQGVKGKIDGAAGADILDFTAYLSRPVSVNLQLKAATNTGGFANVEQFQGGSGTADSFLGVNKVNAWNVTGTGSGDVGGIAFGNFENLTGGTLADNFLLAAAADWLGTLSGGTGTDTLTAAPGPNSWLLTGLNAGTLNGRKFAAVEIRR